MPHALRRRTGRYAILACLLPSLLPAQEYLPPVRVGTITDSRIRELSGMETVTGHPGYYWCHNDSADTGRIFAVREDGEVIAEVKIASATATDWEEIAREPASVTGRPRLWIGDYGNNGLVRDQLALYVFPEPELPSLEPGQVFTSEPAGKIPFRYPDGRHDCEGLVVDPQSGEVYLITKVSGTAGVYRLPDRAPGGPVQTVARIGSLPTGGLVTAATVSLDGRRMLVRTYERVLEYQIGEEDPFERLFTQKARSLPASSSEVQSETICFDHRDRDYLTTSEGNPAPIDRAVRRQEQPACFFSAPDDFPFEFTRGDVVVEGIAGPAETNVTDAAAVAAAIAAAGAGSATLDCPDRYDVDDDGELAMEDVSRLLRTLVALTSPAAPWPLPGTDPTADALGCNESGRVEWVGGNHPWRYLYGAEPPPEEWKEPEFPADGWPAGRGGIGFGNSGLETPLAGRPDLSLALRARAEFLVDDPQGFDALMLEIDRSDGYVAYLNGVEVARGNLGTPGFEVPPEFPAGYHLGGNVEEAYLCPNTLVAGRNVLAIEAHNRSLTDATLYFRARLLGLLAASLSPPSSEPPAIRSATLEWDLDGPVQPGEAFTVRLLARADTPIRGGSLSIRYDSGFLRLRRVIPGGAAEDRSLVEEYGTVIGGRWNFAWVIDPREPGAETVGPQIAGEPFEVARLELEARAREETTARIFLEDRVGSHPLENVLVGERYETVRLEHGPLFVQIVEDGPPSIETVHEGRGTTGATFYLVGRRFDRPGLRVSVCGRRAEATLLADGQTLEVTAPECAKAGPVDVEVCTDEGCDLLAGGFTWEGEPILWLRADANGDATVDISDAIAMLGQLFLGTPASPACPAALDANGDGRFDLSDAIFVLGFLFRGEGPIPPPWPDRAACARVE